jgi:hypothetical protein
MVKEKSIPCPGCGVRESIKSITGISLTVWSKKPGAFENYRYRDAMFPTSRFRIAYDSLKKRYSFKSAAARYLKILYLAAKGSEVAVDGALKVLIDENRDISKTAIECLIESNTSISRPDDIHIEAVDLTCYDQLLKGVAA